MFVQREETAVPGENPHMQKKHANVTKGPSWDFKQVPSWCEARVLTTIPLRSFYLLQHWFYPNFLKFDSSKTEFLHICRWWCPIGFIQPGPSMWPGMVHSWVWSNWNKHLHLNLKANGSQPKKILFSLCGWLTPALSGGAKQSWVLVPKGEWEGWSERFTIGLSSIVLVLSVCCSEEGAEPKCQSACLPSSVVMSPRSWSKV